MGSNSGVQKTLNPIPYTFKDWLEVTRGGREGKYGRVPQSCGCREKGGARVGGSYHIQGPLSLTVSNAVNLPHPRIPTSTPGSPSILPQATRFLPHLQGDLGSLVQGQVDVSSEDGEATWTATRCELHAVLAGEEVTELLPQFCCQHGMQWLEVRVCVFGD